MQLLCEEFLNQKEDDITDMMQDMYWQQDFSSDRLFTYLEESAEKEGVELCDIDEWDYDKELYDMYQNLEKGLS